MRKLVAAPRVTIVRGRIIIRLWTWHEVHEESNKSTLEKLLLREYLENLYLLISRLEIYGFSHTSRPCLEISLGLRFKRRGYIYFFYKQTVKTCLA